MKNYFSFEKFFCFIKMRNSQIIIASLFGKIDFFIEILTLSQTIIIFSSH